MNCANGVSQRTNQYKKEKRLKENRFQPYVFGPILVLNRTQNEKGRGIKNERITKNPPRILEFISQ